MLANFFIRGMTMRNGSTMPDHIGIFFQGGHMVGTLNKVTREIALDDGAIPDTLYGSDKFLHSVKVMVCDA